MFRVNSRFITEKMRQMQSLFGYHENPLKSPRIFELEISC